MAALRTLLGISSPITGSSQLHPPLRGGSLLVGGLLPLRPPYPRCGRLAVAPPLRCSAPLLRHSATLRARSPPPGHAQPPHRRPIGRLARPRRLRVPRHIAPRGAPLPRAGGCAAGCRSIGAARAGPRRAGVRRCAALFPPPARGLRPALWGAHPQGRTPEGGERKNTPIRKLVHIFDPPQRARHVIN